MTKARNLANFVSDGNPLADGTIDVADINGVTSTAAELNILDGATITTAELNGVTGINSSVQTQLDGKLTATNNLSDVTNTSTARTNLGVAVGTDVLAHDSNLQGFVDTFTLPTVDGTAGQVLQTGGAGSLSFSTLSQVADFQEFTTSGTWTKPTGCNFVYVEAVGGGGSGAANNSTGFNLSGGTGGEGVFKLFNAADLASTVTVTIGAGAASVTSSDGADGGDTTFGSHAKAFGGVGGINFAILVGGKRGAIKSTQSNSAVDIMQVLTSAGINQSLNVGSFPPKAGNSLFGGGGGVGYQENTTNLGAAGISEFAGNGGATEGQSGFYPGGGGAAKQNGGNSGAGANGRIRVWAW